MLIIFNYVLLNRQEIRIKLIDVVAREPYLYSMPTSVVIPKASIAMEAATILKWIRTEGDMVAEGEPLLEIETDKVVMEIPAPASGFLLRILVPHGEIKINQTIAWIGDAGEVVSNVAAPAISNKQETVSYSAGAQITDRRPLSPRSR